MFCPECGADLKDGARFCPNCGATLRQGREQEADQTSGRAPESSPASTPEPAPAPAAPSEAMPAQASVPATKPQAPRGNTAAQAPAPTKSTGGRKLPPWAPFAIGGVALVIVVALVVALMPRETSPTGSAPKGEPGTWTVLAYICGSNLESHDGTASTNIDELLSLDLPANVNFLLETGGSLEWKNDQVSAEQIQRFKVANHQLVLEDEQPLTSMGEAGTLSDFISWGVNAHPAEHYMLVFWDHGGGSLVGVCLDEIAEDGLTLTEMNEALTTADVHFDMVGFDTCLMATLETAQMLAPHADYLVASEEIEPACGWAWDEWPIWFANTSDNDPAELGTKIVDTYIERCDNYDVGDTATLSVVDLSHMNEMTDAFGKATEGMARTTERAGTLQKLVVNGRNVESFGYADYLSGYTNMVDLGDLLACVSESLPDAAKEVEQALLKTVIYERHGELHEKSTGLSVFYPLSIDYDTFVSYMNLSQDLGLNNATYLQYLAVRTGVYSKVNWNGLGITDLDPVEESDAKGAFTCTPKVDSSGHFAIEITNNTEFVNVATYSLGIMLPDGTIALMGSSNDLNASVDAHGKITYQENFKGGILNIGGSYVRADIVDMVADADGPLYNLYSVPVELTTTNSLGEEVAVPTNLLIKYDYATNKHRIVCVYANTDDSGMAPKSVQMLYVGDKLKFIATRIIDAQGNTQTGTTGTVTVDENLTVEELNPGDNTYIYSVTVTDIFGNDTPGGTAIITYKDGKRSVEVKQ